MTDILILGGTTEARLLCDAIAGWPVNTTVSLAGATSDPIVHSVRTRVGGFGGPEGLATWLQEHATLALVDATHPFAAKMPWNGFTACEALSIPRLRVLRPPFPRTGQTHKVANLAEALNRIPTGKRVLVTSGRKDIAALQSRPDVSVFLRTIEPVADLPEHVMPLLMRPPFSVEAERDLMQKHDIDILIAKDSGGVTEPKLAAAVTLRIEILLLQRPRQPPGPTVQTTQQAVAWLRHCVGIGT